MVSFSLPDFALTNAETIIEPDVWAECKDELVKGNEIWGVVELGYRLPSTSPKLPGKIKLVSFTDFCPYTVDLDYYKELRAEFDIHEWIDILLGAIDYNASGYADENQKRAVLTRLLPFVEKRLNLIELAPPGTGKSYIFGSISKYGNLSAGYMTRAKLFYDLSKRQPGLVYNNDYVAFDEVHMLSSKKLIPESVPQDVRGSILDTYVLEFLDLPEQYSERNLRKAITGNLKQFILEFGKDFTFIGEEYRVQVGGQDFYIDLLFYNRALSCLVPIELKIGKFKPEHIGQINFYLEALDRDVKKPNENPSVGVILCASKDDAVVEYALSRSMSPTLVADYRLCLPDKTLLQNKLRELTELALESGERDEDDEE